MTSQFKMFSCFVMFGVAVGSPSARADLVITYDVEIVNSMGNPLAGPVSVGTEIFWEINAVVTGEPNMGQNFGIAQASTNLTVTPGESLSPGTIDPLFSSYLSNGGTPAVPPDELTIIQATQLMQNNSTTVGADGNPGSFLLASGSYVATNPGLHTLTTVANVDDSLYFSAASQSVGAAPSFDSTQFDSDTILVQAAVPEPQSLAMMALAVCSAGFLRRRRQSARLISDYPTGGS